MNIVFMGTPLFAVGVLQGLIDNYKDDIVGAISANAAIYLAQLYADKLT